MSQEKLDYLKLREYEQALAQYEKFHSGTKDEFDVEKVIAELKNYEAFFKNKRGVPVLVDFQKLEAVYIGEDVSKYFDYTREELLAMGRKAVFKLLSLEHIGFPLKALAWAKKMHRYKSKSQLEHKCYMSGMKFKGKKGNIMRAFFDLHELSKFDNMNPHYVLLIATNVTHLIKGDFYWGYYVFGPENLETKFFDSKLLSKSSYTVFSEREMEVLKFLNQGSSSQQISEQLFISRGTVEKHRKNMIARLGARDTTAMLELSKMMGLII